MITDISAGEVYQNYEGKRMIIGKQISITYHAYTFVMRESSALPKEIPNDPREKASKKGIIDHINGHQYKLVGRIVERSNSEASSDRLFNIDDL